jgi:DNA-directed RNA polymerase specialized sigma24 family protein
MFLTPKQKIAWRLRKKEGLLQRDIAKRMELSEPEVSRLLSRAKGRVTKLMQLCGGGNCELEALIG